MTFLPVIWRELRAESRRPWLYWSRMAAGACVTAAFAFTAIPQRALVSGLQLFGGATIVVLTLIWLVAPLLTADCLSREKREGTLGLLFLTPLSAAGIVIGKSLVHGLRASTVLLAATPVMAASLLFGGVSAMSVLLMLLHVLGALCLALAAGLLASAWSRDWLRSVLLTVCLTWALGFLYYRAMAQVMRLGTLQPALTLFGLAVFTLASATLLAAWQVRRTWHEGPPSRWSLWWFRTFCSPLFWKDLLQRLSRRTLEQNPIGWLHERTATARVGKWLWCAGAILVECSFITSSGSGISFVAFAAGLGIGMAFAGASSFRRERQSGVMELLLVAPLAAGEIIHSRIRALRKQFAPAVAIILIPLLGVAFLWPQNPTMHIAPYCFLLLTSWATLPTLGLYFSLRVQRFLTAWVLTCLVGMVVPYFFARLLLYPPGAPLVGLAALLQPAVSMVCIQLLKDGLTRQSLALQSS